MSLTASEVAFLEARVKAIRRRIVTTIFRAQAGHPGGSLSAVDILTALYFHVLRVDPARPDWPERDRFILRVTREAWPRVSPEGYQFRIGKACVVREGTDITLFGSGMMVSQSFAAVEQLTAEGASVRVINMSTIKPIEGSASQRPLVPSPRPCRRRRCSGRRHAPRGGHATDPAP